VTLSALVAPWIFAEGFTGRRVLGVALGVAAMVVLSMDDGTSAPQARGGQHQDVAKP
jgi:hypothetical protein